MCYFADERGASLSILLSDIFRIIAMSKCCAKNRMGRRLAGSQTVVESVRSFALMSVYVRVSASSTVSVLDGLLRLPMDTSRECGLFNHLQV